MTAVTGFAFKSVCYDTLAAAEKAACSDTEFWQSTSGWYTSCISHASVSANKSSFYVMNSSGNMSSSFNTKYLNFPNDCVINASYSDTFQYILYTILLAYLTSLVIGAIIKFIRSV